MTVDAFVSHLTEGEDALGRAGRLRSRAIGFPSARRAVASTAPNLSPATVAALAAVGVPARALFAHQSVGVSAALAGDNVVVATGTASGKSVCYNAPALEAMLHDPNATTMYVFPTKALARDQLRALTAMLDGAARATYDDPAYAGTPCASRTSGCTTGDTPEEERRRVRAESARDFHQSGYASRVRASQPPRMGRHAPRAQVRRLGRSARVSRRVRVARRARDASLETRVSRSARRRSRVRRRVGDNRRSRRARLGPRRPIPKTRRGRKGRARGVDGGGGGRFAVRREDVLMWNPPTREDLKPAGRAAKTRRRRADRHPEGDPDAPRGKAAVAARLTRAAGERPRPSRTSPRFARLG